MRGTRKSGRGVFWPAGIIPAYAGNTAPWWRVPASPRDHPRVCGEHVTPWRDSEAILGSSPRMRGTHFQPNANNKRGGIIPAYAGNTLGLSISIVDTQDHPRVCGEHVRSFSGMEGHLGSSPRMRGTPWYSPAIPANSRDHPRVCGEHHRHGNRKTVPSGIIPAYAGNTLRD